MEEFPRLPLPTPPVRCATVSPDEKRPREDQCPTPLFADLGRLDFDEEEDLFLFT